MKAEPILCKETPSRRRTSLVIMHAEIFRAKRAATWSLRIRSHHTGRSQIIDLRTPIQAAAVEFARLKIRDLTRIP